MTRTTDVTSSNYTNLDATGDVSVAAGNTDSNAADLAANARRATGDSVERSGSPGLETRDVGRRGAELANKHTPSHLDIVADVSSGATTIGGMIATGALGLGLDLAGAVVAAAAPFIAIGVPTFDAHAHNAREGAIKGYALGYAAGVFGLDPKGGLMRHSGGVTTKNVTRATHFNDAYTDGYEHASSLSPEQRASERERLLAAMECRGDGDNIWSAARIVRSEIVAALD